MTAAEARGTNQWHEADRFEALLQMEILDTAPETAFDDIVWLAKTLCDAPIVLVSLVAAHRQWFKAKLGLELSETPIATSVCALAIQQDDLFEIADLAADPRTAHFAMVEGPPNIRFYAGIPLATAEGLPLGTLCVIDTEARPNGLNLTQRTALIALGKQTAAQIELRDLKRRRDPLLGAARSVGTWDWHVDDDLVLADARFAELYGVDAERAVRGAPSRNSSVMFIRKTCRP